ncbi:MAG: hypothetical protein RIQ38_2878 [Pseudomonadota bacterium]|jgi:regulator of sirC expression with transglutaminase-like and TPR domain
MTMPPVWSPVTPLQYFESLVASDDDFALLEAAASLAQDEDPGLDVQQVLADVDRLQRRLLWRTREADEETRLAVLNHMFYSSWGFGLNINDYHAPENSYLHEVIRTRRGIPVSLALIWTELARGLGLDAQGISFPGHFLVKVHLSQGLMVLDPVDGQPLTVTSLAQRLAPFRPEDPLDLREGLDAGDTPLGLYLQGCTEREWLGRMLRNLKEIFLGQRDLERALAVQQRLVRVWPHDPTQRRDRGLLLAQLGDVAQARVDLEAYVLSEPEALDAQAVRERLQALGGDVPT